MLGGPQSQLGEPTGAAAQKAIEIRPYAIYIPEIAYPIKRALAKAGVNRTFTSGPKLKDILSGGDKTRPDPQNREKVEKYEWAEHGNAI